VLLQCAAVCCSVLQCVAVCCSVLQCVPVFDSVLQCVVCERKQQSVRECVCMFNWNCGMCVCACSTGIVAVLANLSVPNMHMRDKEQEGEKVCVWEGRGVFH